MTTRRASPRKTRKPASPFDRYSFVAVTARDLAGNRTFWVDQLGLTVTEEEKGHYFILDAGGLPARQGRCVACKAPHFCGLHQDSALCLRDFVVMNQQSHSNSLLLLDHVGVRGVAKTVRGGHPHVVGSGRRRPVRDLRRRQ